MALHALALETLIGMMQKLVKSVFADSFIEELATHMCSMSNLSHVMPGLKSSVCKRS